MKCKIILLLSTFELQMKFIFWYNYFPFDIVPNTFEFDI